MFFDYSVEVVLVESYKNLRKPASTKTSGLKMFARFAVAIHSASSCLLARAVDSGVRLF